MSQMTCCITQSIVYEQQHKNCSADVNYMEKISNVRFRCREKKSFHCFNKTHDWIVKQVGEVFGCDATSWLSGSITSI